MALTYGPTGVAEARRRLRKELYAHGVPDPVIDDAVLILSELLSNSCRHARPLGGDGNEDRNKDANRDAKNGDNGDRDDGGNGGIRATWRTDAKGVLAIEVTDGGGPTRPSPASPSLTARGGRGLGIVRTLSQHWGVRDDASGEVTVWALLPTRARHARRDDLAPRMDVPIDFDDLG
jgi:anti-sigma regulatory factor (Ser/Thr protein kinase)